MVDRLGQRAAAPGAVGTCSSAPWTVRVSGESWQVLKLVLHVVQVVNILHRVGLWHTNPKQASALRDYWEQNLGTRIPPEDVRGFGNLSACLAWDLSVVCDMAYNA